MMSIVFLLHFLLCLSRPITEAPVTLRTVVHPLRLLESSWWFYTWRDLNGSRVKVGSAQGFWKMSRPSTPIGILGFKRQLNFRDGSTRASTATNQ